MRAIAASSTDAANLRYHGGPVQTAPSVYVVFWGYRKDPSLQARRLLAFLRAVGASAWISSVVQYYEGDPAEHITETSAQLRGAWYDNANPVPVHPADAQVAAEAIRAATHFRSDDPNASYFVDTPQGNSTAGFGTKWCAYHGAVRHRGVLIAYTNFPYMTDAGRACGANAVNRGAAGALDGISIIAGHELAETQTDPDTVSGWIDWNDAEIADKCMWLNLRNSSFGAYGKFPTQPLWSNALPGCTQ